MKTTLSENKKQVYSLLKLFPVPYSTASVHFTECTFTMPRHQRFLVQRNTGACGDSEQIGESQGHDEGSQWKRLVPGLGCSIPNLDQYCNRGLVTPVVQLVTSKPSDVGA